MRLLPRLAIGGVVTGSILAPALVAAGLLLAGTAVVVTAPTPAHADSLTSFESCQELRDWYVDNSLPDVGPWGWEGEVGIAGASRLFGRGPVPLAAEADSTTGAFGTTKAARANSKTGTNTQEAGVDEPDLAKTDGRVLIHLTRGRTVVIDDVTGRSPRRLGAYRLPRHIWSAELLLVGDRVVVVSQDAAHNDVGRGDVAPLVAGRRDRSIAVVDGTRVLVLDVSTPAAPRLVSDRSFSGRVVSARQYGDVIRIVTHTEAPRFDWMFPDRRRGIDNKEARRHNRDLVRSSTIEDWLPVFTDNRTATRRGLVACEDVFHPADLAGPQTLTVTTFTADAPERPEAVAVTAAGFVAYSSPDRLYVTSTDHRATPARSIFPRRSKMTTRIHAFALAGMDTRYVASGQIHGSIQDRWSLNEHQGMLRVAWTDSASRRTSNGVTVLREQGNRLVPVGSVGDLGVTELIQSVRWFDDLAIVVTFRQVDPLYTVDLRNPAAPRVLGELKIPGFSSYLHPIGGDRLLGMGTDATLTGRITGAQAAVFDITDLADPRQTGRVRFPDSQPTDDPRSFTWLPDSERAVTLITDWYGTARLVALHVSSKGRITTTDLLDRVAYDARALPLPDGRVAVVGSTGRVELINVIDSGGSTDAAG